MVLEGVSSGWTFSRESSQLVSLSTAYHTDMDEVYPDAAVRSSTPTL